MRADHFGRISAAGVVIAATLVSAAPALAGARAGARYDGRDATHKRAFVAVSKDGRRIRAFGFATRPTCSDGKRHLVFFESSRRAKPRVLPDGSFNDHLTSGRDRGNMSGRFDLTGNAVTGSYSISVRTRHYRCKTGTVGYVLNRDGTSGAPYRTGTVASGLYRAAAPGLQLQMRPLVPAGLIHSFDVVYATKCSSGKPQPWELRLVVAIRKGNRFAALVRDRRRLKGGGSETLRTGIAGSFAYAQGYKLGGALKARNVIRRPGRRPVVCRGSIRFAGRFIRGPLGEEGPHPAS
jgi:hypothetical protein